MAIERTRIGDRVLEGQISYTDGSAERIEVRQILWRDQHGFETSTFEAVDGRELDLSRLHRLTISLDDDSAVTFHGGSDT